MTTSSSFTSKMLSNSSGIIRFSPMTEGKGRERGKHIMSTVIIIIIIIKIDLTTFQKFSHFLGDATS